MGRFLDPKADLTFKKVFGEHKHLVMSLLNALLPLKAGREVVSIEYLPPEMTPRTPLSKDTIVDVRCEETGGRKFIVEMQMNWRSSYEQRALFNAAKAYSGQLTKGEDYDLLQPVYSLNLVNDTFDWDTADYYHHYQLVEDQNHRKVLDGLHLVFVELPKFRPETLAEKKMQVLWLRFLTEIDENTRRVPQELLDDPHVNEALEIVEESAYTPGEMRAYDKFWDRMSLIATDEAERRRTLAALDEAKAELGEAKAERRRTQAALDEAKAELGEAKAERRRTQAALESAKAELGEVTARADAAKARADAATAERDAATARLHQTVRQMRADGMTAGMIAKYTGLTPAEIDAIR